MSNSLQFATKEERMIFDFLKDGPKEHNEILRHFNEQRKSLQGKGYKISESTINRILNENEGKRVFRVQKGERIFYRLNDFPNEINKKLALLATLKTINPEFKPLGDRLTANLALLYPKHDYNFIVRLTCTELLAQYQNDAVTSDFVRRLKEMC